MAAFVSIAVWISTASSVAVALLWLTSTYSLVLLSVTRGNRIPAVVRLAGWSLPAALVVLALYAVLTTADGELLWRVGPIAIGREGTITGVRLAFRFLAFVALARSLTFWITPTGLAAGLSRLLRPLAFLGIGIGNLYYLLFFIARMTPALAEEARIIRLGQESRGLRVAGSWPRRVRNSVSLIVPVFAAAMRRSERLSLVLASRGFDPRRVPEIVTSLRFRIRDWLLMVVVGAGWLFWALSWA